MMILILLGGVTLSLFIAMKNKRRKTMINMRNRIKIQKGSLERFSSVPSDKDIIDRIDGNDGNIEGVPSVFKFEGSSPFDSSRDRLSSQDPNAFADRNILHAMRPLPSDESIDGQDVDINELGLSDDKVIKKGSLKMKENAEYFQEMDVEQFSALIKTFSTFLENRDHARFVRVDPRDIPRGARYYVSKHLEDQMRTAYRHAFNDDTDPKFRVAALDLRVAFTSFVLDIKQTTSGNTSGKQDNFYNHIRVGGIACFHRKGKSNGLCVRFVADVYPENENEDERVNIRTIVPSGTIPEQHLHSDHVTASSSSSF